MLHTHMYTYVHIYIYIGRRLFCANQCLCLFFRLGAADRHEQVPQAARGDLPPRPRKLPAAHQQGRLGQGRRAEEVGQLLLHGRRVEPPSRATARALVRAAPAPARAGWGSARLTSPRGPRRLSCGPDWWWGVRGASVEELYVF